jgi:hypothetical protein
MTAGRTADGPSGSVDQDAGSSDALTGGVTAPNEETGFGHGVDGLTPVAPTTPSVQLESTTDSSLRADGHATSGAGAASAASSSTGSSHGAGAGGAQRPAPE